MKNTAGCNSLITFLNVFNFGFKPAELTPKNLKDFSKHFLLFLFPLFLFCLLFLTLILINFLLYVLFVDSFSCLNSLLEVLGSPEHCEKPKVLVFQ